MPNIKSAKKRLRQNVKRRQRNRYYIRRLKTESKKVLAAVEEKNLELAKEQLKVAMKYIERAAARGVIHKNEAARRMSRIAKAVAQLEKELSTQG
ncbi:30S ribosomal protein S20 [Desulfurobacterium atlanticum]|uniref:Small ribosomal subunit protein bS20 n=1 Tax=Desulfurobacterium atlanticum TaxID=240169 RepID=A0A238YP77_9BACT|nr:30S ribosomal protein S20 [Desulfurobacterium atlanticum]SNR72820.1 SSU ribosomal protein S20P [Desulfurobacterium atlanticum]